MTHIQRPITTEPRTGLSREELWDGPDKGLIKCWEVGRDRAQRFPELAQRCLAGELPVLGWKGGVSRSLKKTAKFGCLKYLAQWQGLRGEDLDIDLAQERTLTCSNTNMIVTFTPDRAKYVNQEPA
ncbi:hypothetical protein [Pseudomonas sp. Z2-11]